MAAGLTATITLKPLNRHYKPILFPHLNKPILFNPLRCFPQRTTPKTQKLKSFTLCVLMNDPKQNTQIEIEEEKSPLQGENDNNYSQVVSPKMEEKLKRKKSERLTYLIAAVMSSLGITSMAVLSVYYRFSWQMEVNWCSSSLNLFVFLLFFIFFAIIFIYLFMHIVVVCYKNLNLNLKLGLVCL